MDESPLGQRALLVALGLRLVLLAEDFESRVIERRDVDRAPGELAQPPEESSSPPSAPELPPVDPDGILRTPEGLRRKVLVKSLDLAPLRIPGGPRGLSSPLDYFSIHYVYSDRERDAYIKDGQAAGKRLPKENAIQRYKGLGEMDYQELWETTMSPEHRTLLQVSLDEAAAADEIFSVLMGEDVESRRSFIQRNAKDVRFLDI